MYWCFVWTKISLKKDFLLPIFAFAYNDRATRENIDTTTQQKQNSSLLPEFTPLWMSCIPQNSKLKSQGVTGEPAKLNTAWSAFSTRQKIRSLEFNRTEQCCTAHIVYSCLQHRTILLRLNCV